MCIVPECKDLEVLPIVSYDNGRTQEYPMCGYHYVSMATELVVRYLKYDGITDGARIRVNGLEL